MDWVNSWVRGGRTLPVVSCVVLLCAAYACGESTRTNLDVGAGGSGGVGGSGEAGERSDAGGSGGGSTSASGGTTTTQGGGSGGMGPAGAGGEAGATDSSSTGGTAGTSGVTCTVAPPDDCEYPESLGGGSDSDACGVTPGAWFGIGESAGLTPWPERATSPSGGLLGSFRTKFGSHQLAFDPASLPVIAWQEEDPAGGTVMRVSRWNGSSWVELLARNFGDQRRTFDLVVDSSGRPLLVERSDAMVEVLRYTDSEWETLGSWPISRPLFAGIVLDADDHPTVVYGAADALVQRWTGSTWEDLGAVGIEPVPYQYSDPVLALRANGEPVVAFHQGDTVMLRQWSGSSWDELDGSASGSGLGEWPCCGYHDRSSDREIALGVDAVDRVVVAWGGSYRVWSGSAWSAIGSVGGPHPKLARNAEGALYLMTKSALFYATDRDVTDAEIMQERHLYRWTGDSWESLTPTTVEFDEAVDLAVAPDGHLGSAFGDQQVFYRGYAEASWTGLDTPAAGAGIGIEWGSSPGVADVPALVLERDLPVRSGCAVSQWNGTTWEVVPTPTYGASCSYARNADGNAYLAFWYTDPTQDVNIGVAQQTNDGWKLLGDPGAYQDNAAFETSLAIDSHGRPVVAWLYGELQTDAASTSILGWNGSSWTAWSGSRTVPLETYDEATWMTMTLTQDDRPVLAVLYRDVTPGKVTLQVSEWTGEDWRVRDVMTHEVADFSVPITKPTLAVDATDAPVVSWATESGLDLARWSGSDWERLAPTNDTLADLPPSLRVEVWPEWSASGEVFFRYFKDCAWHGLSASERGGGVSNSSMLSFDPRVWATEHDVCVSWTEVKLSGSDAESSDVLMRCHEW